MFKKILIRIIIFGVIFCSMSNLNNINLVYAELPHELESTRIDIKSHAISNDIINIAMIYSTEEIKDIKIYINDEELTENHYSIERNTQINSQYSYYLNQYNINLNDIELKKGEYSLRVYVIDSKGMETGENQIIQIDSVLNDKTNITSTGESFVTEKNSNKELADAIDDIPVTQSSNLLAGERESAAIVHSFKVSEGSHVGTEYKLTATATSPNTILYQFAIQDLSTNKWTFLSSYGESNTATWIPNKVGEYRIRARVKDSESISNQDSRLDYFVTVEQPKAQIIDLKVLEGGYAGTEYVFESTATSPNTTLYQFAIQDLSTNKWTFLSPYGESNTGTWTPKKAGRYGVRARVIDSFSNSNQDARIDYILEVKNPVAEITGFKVLEGGYTGTNYKLEATANSVNNVLYQFAIQDLSTNKWTFLSPYGESSTDTWTSEKAGRYRIRARVIDSFSNSDQDARIDYILEVKNSIAKITNFKVTEGGYTGTSYKLEATANSINNVLYQFAIQDLSTNKWTFLSSYGKSNTSSWTPEKPGRYRIRARVIDSFSNSNQDARIDYILEVKNPIAKIDNFKVMEGGYAGTSYKLEASANTINHVLYQFAIQDLSTNKWTFLSSYSTSNKGTWIPKKAGEYRIRARVKDLHSKNDQDSRIDYIVNVKSKITIMLDPGHEGKYPLDPGAVGNGLYEYQLNNSLTKMIASKLEAQGYNVIYTRNPNIEGPAPLKERDEKVNSLMPDLLISIHHDSSVNRSASGYSIFWSSYRYRIDKSGIVVTENGVDYPFVTQIKRMVNGSEETYIVYNKNGKNVEKNINDSDGVITVRDRTLSTVAKESQRFANILHSKLQALDYINPRPSPVNNNNIYIIRETNVPTVLFEGGFISNPTEAQKIKNTTNQNKFANKVVEAVNAYFQ